MSCTFMEDISSLAGHRILHNRRHTLEEQRFVSRMRAQSIHLKAELLRIRNMCRVTVRRYESRTIRRLILDRYLTVLLSLRTPDILPSSLPIRL